MLRSVQIAIATAALACAGSASAQSFAESGWRASTSEEVKMREAFEGAQDDWNSRRDGEDERYNCVMEWAVWSDVARSFDTDNIPAISGGLMHSYADAHMSHHLSYLVRSEGGDARAVGEKLAYAAQRFANRPDEELKETMQSLGKCYVQPLSWSIMPNYKMTGPQLLEMLGADPAPSMYPPWTKSPKARQQFDQYIMDKDFVSAANLGAQLHGANDKTTVMWNEVLRASLLSVEEGRGLALSDPLLQTLSEVWWPRHRRDWARNLLRQKHGLPSEQASRPPLYNPSDEPGWVKQERRWQQNGQLNYIPCNQWNRTGC